MREIAAISAVHQLFETQAARTPDAAALVFGDQILTFQQVERRANHLAYRLRRAGAEPGAVVGVHLERAPEMVIGVLAICKAGAAFVPLDPAFPAPRLAFILQDTQARLVLSQSGLRNALPEYDGGVLLIGDGEADAPPDDTPDPDRLLFVLYTSGSTGMPKGILGTHRTALALCRWTFPGAPPDESGVYCFARSLNFIGGLFDILRPLVTGRPMIILTEDERRDVRLLTETVTRHKITRLAVTPSVLRGMLDAFPDLTQRLRSVSICILAGEPLTLDLARRACHALPGIPILNTYGATEVTGVATIFDVRSLAPDAVTVPIGKPINGVQVHILSDDGQKVPDGAVGEICIGGAGVTRGYLNLPDLDAARFVPDALCENRSPGARLFRTGDRGRFAPDGSIEHLGRADHQVSVRGFRIELGEIEAALTRHAAVAAVAVIVREDIAGDPRIVAYAAVKGSGTIRAADLRTFLVQTLPDYMVPSAFVLLPELPLNASGKIDRSHLPAPETVPAAPDAEQTPPRDDTETTLAALWRSALRAARIGIDDSFFDLGGDSLLAIRLLGAVEQEFGVSLSLSSLLTAPTIRQMALLVRRQQDEGTGQRRSGLIPLQTQGDAFPLFCPPVGSAFCYRALAPHIGATQPFYTLESGGRDGPNGWEPLRTVEEMADCYLEQIRSLQPRGPYYLGGHSFAGLVAFEMARQLMAAGEPIGLLVLFDTWAPGFPVKSSKSAAPSFPLIASLRDVSHHIGYHRDCVALCPTSAARAAYIAAFARRLIQRTVTGRKSRRRGDVSAPVSASEREPSALPERYVRGLRAEETARKSYRPAPYSGDIVLLRARLRTTRFQPEPHLGWQHVVGGTIRVISVPGTHTSLMAEPYVRVTAAHVRKLLIEAQEP